MFPQMQNGVLAWEDVMQVQVITTTAVDFEAVENVEAVVKFDVMTTPMKAQKISRKPEGQRSWKWLDAYTETQVHKNDVLQDDNGDQYRVDSIYDWSQAGFWKLELVQQPLGAP